MPRFGEGKGGFKKLQNTFFFFSEELRRVIVYPTFNSTVPTAALTGYNPADHPKLGFTYYLFDREFGEQTFSVGSQFPFAADPSLWGTLELRRE